MDKAITSQSKDPKTNDQVSKVITSSPNVNDQNENDGSQDPDDSSQMGHSKVGYGNEYTICINCSLKLICRLDDERIS